MKVATKNSSTNTCKVASNSSRHDYLEKQIASWPDWKQSYSSSCAAYIEKSDTITKMVVKA